MNEYFVCHNVNVVIFIMRSVCVIMFELSNCVCHHTGAVVMSEVMRCAPKSIPPRSNGPVCVSELEPPRCVLTGQQVSAGRV